MTLSHIQRFENAARQSPQSFRDHVRRVTGHDPATVAAMLQAWQHLEQGGSLTPQHVKMLQRAHPDVASEVPRLAGMINGLPSRVRGDALLATVSGDRAVLDGRYGDASEGFKQVKALASDWARESMAQAIHDRREANADPAIAARTIEREPADPLSTRAILESQWGGDHGKLVRRINEGVKAGDHASLETLRGNLADKAADALERLSPEASESASLRETVSAAADFAEVESIAADQLGIEPEAST